MGHLQIELELVQPVGVIHQDGLHFLQHNVREKWQNKNYKRKLSKLCWILMEDES